MDFEKDARALARRILRKRGSLRYRVLLLRRATVLLEIERDALECRPGPKRRVIPPLAHRAHV